MEGDEKTIKYAIIAACALSVVFIGVLMMTNNLDRGFSELYFEDHRELPAMVDVGEKVDFAFTVVSHEKETRDYTYNVTFGENVVKSGNFSLRPDENISINVSLVPDRSSLVLFDIHRVGVFTAPLNGFGGKIILPLTGASYGPEVGIDPSGAKDTVCNYSEVRRVGEPNKITVDGPAQISSLGYILSKEQGYIVDDGAHRTLKHLVREWEYRYEMLKISANVTSMNEAATADRNFGDDGDESDNYEIYFNLIVEEDPESLLNL
jgi:hypothetical protein